MPSVADFSAQNNQNTAANGAVLSAQIPTIQLDPTLPFLKPRARQTHKGSYGTLLLVCGSYGMIGAAAMAAEAAVYLHGAVGDLCAETLSQTSIQPTDMIEALPAYFASLRKKNVAQ